MKVLNAIMSAFLIIGMILAAMANAISIVLVLGFLLVFQGVTTRNYDDN